MSGPNLRARRLPVVLLPLALTALLALALRSAGPPPVPVTGTLEFDSCTSILVGRLASADGSTMTSHSCDSGTDRTWITLEPRRTHPAGAKATIWLDPKRTTGPEDADRVPVGEIPQVAQTWKFLNAAYPIMNEHQLAIGETTTGGKRELKSNEGIIDAP
jgi:dipeptidase